MKQMNKDRFHSKTMANTYNEICQLLVPGYDLMQDTMINFIKFEDIKNIVLLDLGAGSGILLERILKEFNDSICYYLDYSHDFMTIAKEKLKKYEDRVTYIKSDFTGNWKSMINEKPNVITSMSAIHHLLNKDKKKLYLLNEDKKKLNNKCYNILQEGGWFFNIDEMKTINEDSYIKSLYYWIYHAEKQKNMFSDDLSKSYRVWMEKFDSWKNRNVKNIHLPKKEGDDVHESFLTQLDWLKQIGFSETDIFCKYFLWGMIGGKKC